MRFQNSAHCTALIVQAVTNALFATDAIFLDLIFN